MKSYCNGEILHPCHAERSEASLASTHESPGTEDASLRSA